MIGAVGCLWGVDVEIVELCPPHCCRGQSRVGDAHTETRSHKADGISTVDPIVHNIMLKEGVSGVSLIE